MLYGVEERIYPIFRLCLLGYSKEEIVDKILFSKTNLFAPNPYTFDEVDEALEYFYTDIYNDSIGKTYPLCKKAKQIYEDSKKDKDGK